MKKENNADSVNTTSINKEVEHRVLVMRRVQSL
jgi:hypothetical protein